MRPCAMTACSSAAGSKREMRHGSVDRPPAVQPENYRAWDSDTVLTIVVALVLGSANAMASASSMRLENVPGPVRENRPIVGRSQCGYREWRKEETQ